MAVPIYACPMALQKKKKNPIFYSSHSFFHSDGPEPQSIL